MSLEPIDYVSREHCRIVHNCLPLGVVLLDQGLTPVNANRAGSEHLSAWIAGRPRATTASAAWRLPDEIAGAFEILQARPLARPASSLVVSHPVDRTLCCTAFHARDRTTGDAFRFVFLERVLGRGSWHLRVCRLATLSDAERNVAYRLLTGQSNQEIAESLCLSEHTVKSHFQRIFDKFQVRSRSELLLAILQ